MQKEKALEIVKNAMEEALATYYAAEDIENGDITPMQSVKWDSISEEMAELFSQLAKQNRRREMEDFKSKISVDIDQGEYGAELFIAEESSSGCQYPLDFSKNNEEIAAQCAEQVKNYILDLLAEKRKDSVCTKKSTAKLPVDIVAVDHDGLKTKTLTISLLADREQLKTNENVLSAMRAASLEYCTTKEGMVVYSGNCDNFNFGDFDCYVPDQILKKYGLEKVSSNIEAIEVDFNEQLVSETEISFYKWALTDDDCFQIRRKMKDGVYELYQICNVNPIHEDKAYKVAHAVIDISQISDYQSVLDCYGYDSIEQLKDIYREEWEGVLAECEFELRALECLIPTPEMSYKGAESLIRDNSGYRE